MEIDLHVTNRCNLFCEHCVYKSGALKMKDLALEDVKKISQDLKKMKVEEVHLTGGEPLLNQEIFKIITFLKGDGYLIRIQTNGMLIDQNIAKKLKNCGVNHVLISIDGLAKEHNKFRDNPTSFEKALEAVQILLENKIYTRINTVLHRRNLNDVEELLTITSKMKVQQHSFFYLTPIGRGEDLIDQVLSLEEWKKAKERVLIKAKRLNFIDKVKVQNVFQEDVKKEKQCRLYYRDNCLIMASGDVYPCVFFVHSPYKLGNIHERSLSEIWQDDKNWKQYFIQREKRCFNQKCDGGCRGLAYLLTKSLVKCDPRCEPKNKLIPNCIRTYTGTPS